MTQAREARRNDQIKALGLCRKCKTRPATVGHRCLECKQTALKRDEALRAAGLCTKCKQPAKKGHPRCSKCLEQDRVRVRLKHRARRASGICAQCPTPTTNYLCPPCAEKRRPYHKERRTAYLAVGICPRCAVRPVEINRTFCPECLLEQRDCSRRRFADPKALEKKRIEARNFRQARSERGECPRCGEPATDGFKHCTDCRGVMRAKANIDGANRRKAREKAKKDAAEKAILDAREHKRLALLGEVEL